MTDVGELWNPEKTKKIRYFYIAKQHSHILHLALLYRWNLILERFFQFLQYIN